MARKEDHQSLKKAIEEFISSHKLQHGIDQIRVREAWDKTLGPGVHNYTTEVKLKGDVLYVSLSSSVLREELSLGRSKIVEMLNGELGSALIRKLILR